MSDFEDRVFIINKQSGPTSFEVVEAFRAVSGLRQVGHAGTLDPLAAGVLIVCTGIATRAVEHFVNLRKCYEFEVRLGEGTSTLDAEGEVVERAPCPDLAPEALCEAARGFVGDCVLAPPAYSAIKKNGRRLYAMARAGESPVVEGKKVRIHSLEVTRVDLPVVGFRLECSRGTYVRSLAREFASRFALPAHVRNLVRTAVGPFRVEDAFPSDRIFRRDAQGLEGFDLSRALDFLPGIVINAAAGRGLLNGVLPGLSDVLRSVGASGSERALRILDEGGALLAVGTRSEGADRNRLACVDSYRLLVGGKRSVD
jgi:tRNA pseudouridine55 synthase